jgi:PAS domain S-box-containing protein
MMKEKLSRGETMPTHAEIDIVREDGDIRHLQALFKEIFWNGKLQYQTLYNDITERKQAEKALKASEENFRNSMDSSSMGIRIMGNADYTLYANQALLDMFGYENIEALRASPPQEHYTPESHADFIRRKEQFARGELLPNTFEFDIVRKDGAIRNIQLSSNHVFWNGKEQFQILYTDITERKQAQEALRVSEEKYRLIVENSQDIIFTLDSAGKFIYVSPSVKQMLGYNQTDLIGRPFNSLVHPDDLHVIEDAIQRGDEAGYHQYRFRHASGEWRWHASRGTKMLDTGGKTFNFTGISNDITERKKTEEALMLSEQNFRNSIDSSSVGIRISDIDNHTLYANQTLLDIFGYKNIDELKSTPPHEYYSPEYYTDYLELKEKLLLGESMPNQMEIDIVRKDGAMRNLQALFKEVFWDGKKQYQSLYTDITERKQSEEKLKQAAQEWRTTFDSITDHIFIHDKDNRIIMVNKAVADMLKTTPNELVGKYCHEVMHGSKEPPANCPHLLTLKTGKSAAIEWLNPDTETYFHESSSPVFSEKGEVTGSIIVARDITQQKRIEQQLIMTDRLASIGELSSGIAHELNNPLTSVIGFSQLLMEGDVPANIKEDLATIYNEAQRAAVIVKNLLTFARKHAPVKQLSQVNTVIEDVLKLRTYEQKVNNIEVEKHLAINLPGIMIDYFQMQQVFLNIVVNAEFAMLEAHHKGRLTITTEKVDDIIRISFTDEGPGIPEENLKRIFDPFFTTKEVGKGTGLGLSICHGIVSEHGGKIYAKSENGQGTSFIVELPLNGQ